MVARFLELRPMANSTSWMEQKLENWLAKMMRLVHIIRSYSFAIDRFAGNFGARRLEGLFAKGSIEGRDL